MFGGMAESRKDRSLNVLFGATEWQIITRTAETLDISLGAAVRLLVRQGARGQHPFTPNEKENPK